LGPIRPRSPGAWGVHLRPIETVTVQPVMELQAVLPLSLWGLLSASWGVPSRRHRRTMTHSLQPWRASSGGAAARSNLTAMNVIPTPASTAVSVLLSHHKTRTLPTTSGPVAPSTERPILLGGVGGKRRSLGAPPRTVARKVLRHLQCRWTLQPIYLPPRWQ